MKNGHRQHATLSLAAAAWLAGALQLPLLGCAPDAPRAFGEPVDLARATPLADLLETGQPLEEGLATVVTGRIGEVCTTAGCWFALQDVKDGKAYELLIDLKGSASFTVPRDVKGRPAVVQGRIVGSRPDLRLLAVGVVVE